MHAQMDRIPNETVAAPACCAHGHDDAPVVPADITALYTCPMHPEIRHMGPGACPVCGMALEPLSPVAGPNAELQDMKQRLALSAMLTAPLMAMEMGRHMGMHMPMSHLSQGLLQAGLATPVVVLGGAPFFKRGLASLQSRHLNMFTLIAMGTGVSYLYSLAVLLLPSVFGVAHWYFESAAMIVTLVLLGQVLELMARDKTSHALSALLNLAPKQARLVADDGSERDVAVAAVVAGQFLRVRPGENVPVDGVVVEGESTINQAMVTGESLPVSKHIDDEVIGGTMNNEGSFIMRAERVGADTMLARIAAMVVAAQRSKAPIQGLADKVSGYFVPGVLVVAMLTAAAWGLWGEHRLLEALMNAVAVLIIACPCALGLATPMSIMCGTGRGAQAGVLVREAAALERLEDVDVMVLDKTGTITVGAPKLITIMPTEGHSEPNLLRLAASLEINSEHPLSAAIVRAARERGLGMLKTHAFKSITGKGISGILDGRSVVMGSEALLESLHIPVTLKTKAKPYQSQGQTVIFVAMDGHCIGLLMLADPVKADAADCIKALKECGIRVVMMTGDSQQAAMSVARKLGIDDVQAEVVPEKKAELVQGLQAKGHKVAMVGDGVNDAPALAQADVGIAMGTGTDVAMESAGITLASGELMGLVRARRLSVGVMKNIRQNLFFAFGYNALAVPVAAGVFYPWFGLQLSPVVASTAMAASSLCVVGNALRLRKLKL